MSIFSISKLFRFSFLMTIIIVLPFLSYGYIQTLDVILGQINIRPEVEINVFSNYLVQYSQYLMAQVLATVVVQKIYLGILFFLMLYLPLRFTISVCTGLSGYIMPIFIVVNPFVYERFLAGQWEVLFGYALLWPFVYYLVEFSKEVGGWGLNEGRSTLKIFGYKVEVGNFAKLLIATFLVGAVSFHFLIMCLVILFFTFIYLLILNRKYFLTNFKKLFVVAGVFVLASSYWLVPTVWNIYNNEYVVQGFGVADRTAFTTSVYGESKVTKVLNIFNLYGFWGERHPWAKQFDILPNQNSIVFLPVLIVILLGIVVLTRRNWTVGVVVVGGVILSAIFSLGVADTVFRPVNEWLFNNVFFWNGFRDSQKWTGMLIVFMAIGLGYGLSYILGKIEEMKKLGKNILNLKIIFLCAVVLCIVLYTPKVLTGFSDKLRPVDYPATWYQANEVLVQDFKSGGQEGCVAIFLPWHMYYPLGFNNGLLTANPAQKFFDCKMYTSLDPEIGGVGVGVVKDKVAVLVHGEMQKFIDGDYGYEETVNSLRSLGVQYIVLSSDTLRGERFLNPKNVPGVEQIYDSADIAIFKL